VLKLTTCPVLKLIFEPSKTFHRIYNFEELVSVTSHNFFIKFSQIHSRGVPEPPAADPPPLPKIPGTPPLPPKPSVYQGNARPAAIPRKPRTFYSQRSLDSVVELDGKIPKPSLREQRFSLPEVFTGGNRFCFSDHPGWIVTSLADGVKVEQSMVVFVG